MVPSNSPRQRGPGAARAGCGWTTLVAHIEGPNGIPIDPELDQVTIGSLPGDVDKGGVTAPSDILHLIDHLNGVVTPPLETEGCDIDRSGVCGPPDILRLIDLLNGANTSRPWLNVSLPPRP